MHMLRLCAVAALAGASSAAEPALLALSIPDPARLAAPAAPGADAAWSGLAGRAQAFRVRIDAAGWSGGLPALAWAAAWRSPAGEDPAPVPALRLVRDGGWFHASWGAAAGRAGEIQSAGDGRELVRGALHVPALVRAMPPARAAALGRLAGAWSAAGAAGVATRDGDGPAETIRLPGARIPLGTVDPAALAGLPADAPLVLAWGHRGPALAGLLADLLVLAAGDPLPEPWPGRAAALWDAIEGTVVVARLADGGWVLSLPAAPVVDEVMAHLPGVDGGAADSVLVHEQPVAVGLPGIGPAQVRRTAGRWLLARDPGILNTLAAEAPPPWSGAWPGEGRPLLVLRAAAGVDGALPWLPETAAGLIPASGPAPLLLAVAEEADGLRLDARNGPLWRAAQAVSAVAPRLPALAAAEAAARRRLAEEQLRGMLAAGALRARQADGLWPRDLADLLRAPVPGAPGRPDIAMPWAYVRPVDGADGRPVLVQDPACSGGAGGLVGFRDGRISFIEGRTAWEAAQRVLAGQGSEDL